MKAVCPICSRELEEERAVCAIEVDERLYFLCSERCENEFDENLDRYLEVALEPAPAAPP